LKTTFAENADSSRVPADRYPKDGRYWKRKLGISALLSFDYFAGLYFGSDLDMSVTLDMFCLEL
jgi:hypothetical protein